MLAPVADAGTNFETISAIIAGSLAHTLGVHVPKLDVLIALARGLTA